jgi:TRAP-type C4-dicarboxylate transport system permease small subunit
MAKIASVLRAIEKVLARINLVVVVACGVLLFGFVFMVVGDVTGRYSFDSPIPGTMEIGEIVLAFVVFLGWAAVLANEQHIRVLIVVDRLPPRWRPWFEILALAVGLAMMAPIAWHGWSFAMDSYITKEIGFTYSIPRYPGKMALFVGSALFAVQFLIMFFRHLFSRLAGEIPATKERG